MSRPAWDAWIEIELMLTICRLHSSRVPHGTRGLKYFVFLLSYQNLRSRPAWDAWIEISSTYFLNAAYCVASRMGRVD